MTNPLHKATALPIFFTLCALLLFTNADCKKDIVDPPPTNPLQLTVEDVTCTEASLKLSLAGSEKNRSVVLKRSDSTIATLTMAGTDSLFIDEGLLPNRTYTYTLTDGNWRATAQATTLDTTSHNIQWQLPDTLGVQGLIRDVWVFSKTNAWAVGEIFLRDSNGAIDNGTRYNGAHWDGAKWTLMRIPYYYQGQPIYNPLYCAFAFSENDIWFAGNGVIHWNGQQFIPAEIPASVWGPFLVNKMWGTSSNNLFIVGEGGSIANYSNGVWTKQESHTTVNLQDVWGIDNEHVWATGTNVRDGHSVVLQYDGKQWSTIYDNAGKPFSEFFGFMTLWTDTPSRMYLDGGSWFRIMNLKNYSISQPVNTGRTYVSVRLRGTSRNDIFNVGPVEISHNNGYGWFRYSYPNYLYNEAARFSNVFPTKDFIIMGGYYYTGLNGIPVVVRGYR
jgi:hypothetical protein